eukprot:CAMPEP_0206301348 /NCGR_PEP_ID=MMETSP0106_2-20121207/8165_1 /ASSEMBLY_ACC=CAM_ASM_000206 /TAXON_ID=81532 /ORGANISM="Acanthoeca-like sp., Strain 10tr" /LENGTH=30 /DNA_ID= /DNA_START= /DNA_END= /DNA_ORIENTATION=
MSPTIRCWKRRPLALRVLVDMARRVARAPA